MKWSSCGWSFYQLEQWCPPLTVKPFRAQSFTLLRPNLFPVSQSKNDQKSASDGLRSNFNSKCFSLSCPGPISVLEALRQKWCFFPHSFYQSCLLAWAGGRYGWMNIHSLRAERGFAATCCQQRQLWFLTTLSPVWKPLSHQLKKHSHQFEDKKHSHQLKKHSHQLANKNSLTSSKKTLSPVWKKHSLLTSLPSVSLAIATKNPKMHFQTNWASTLVLLWYNSRNLQVLPHPCNTVPAYWKFKALQSNSQHAEHGYKACFWWHREIKIVTSFLLLTININRMPSSPRLKICVDQIKKGMMTGPSVASSKMILASRWRYVLIRLRKGWWRVASSKMSQDSRR